LEFLSTWRAWIAADALHIRALEAVGSEPMISRMVDASFGLQMQR